MTREEWLAVLDSEPVTPNQRGAIMRECSRLGITGRAERLAILAAMLGFDALESTADLTQGQGGYLVRALSEAGERADLPTVPSISGQDDEPEEDRMSLIDVLLQIVISATRTRSPLP